MQRWSGLRVFSLLCAVGVLLTAWFAAQYVLLVAALSAAVAVLDFFSTTVPQSEEREEGEHLGSTEYELLEKLGEGGMGEVFRARQIGLRRDVAVKRIKPVRTNEEDRRRFRREARVLSTLSNPHTINVFDAGIHDDGTFFYVMELLDGIDLEKLVVGYGPQEPARVIHILRQAALSLAEAHLKGLVHRDLKPANLMVCRYGGESDFVKVLDFGLVKGQIPEGDGEGEPLTQDEALPGTPAFWAPESIRGSKFVDARADIYAFGALGHYLLTGRFLFEEETPMGMIRAQLNDEPQRASAQSPYEVPEALDEFLAHCLKKDVSERPQSIQEVLVTLESLALAHPWPRESALQWWQQVPVKRTSSPSLPPLPSEIES